MILSQEEELWALKFRVNWMIQGDCNTAFHHVSTLVRRKRNRIVAMKNAIREWMNEESQIKEFIRRGFEEVYTTSLSTASRAPCICSQWQPRLSEEKKVSISNGVTEEEVKTALWSLKVFKALGPYGLHAGFFQRFWPTVGKSVADEVKKIFEERKIPEY